MCAGALAALPWLRRVVFGCGNDKFGGCGSVLPVLRAGERQAVPCPAPVLEGFAACVPGAFAAAAMAQAADRTTVVPGPLHAEFGPSGSSGSEEMADDGREGSTDGPMGARAAAEPDAAAALMCAGAALAAAPSAVMEVDASPAACGEPTAAHCTRTASSSGGGGSAAEYCAAGATGGRHATDGSAAASVVVQAGLYADAAVALLKAFYSRGNTRTAGAGRPSAAIGGAIGAGAAPVLVSGALPALGTS